MRSEEGFQRPAISAEPPVMKLAHDLRPTTLAIAALGGQGGGVLAEWIVSVAERGGYLAQYTSVAGVAQRTGATIYYIEMFPEDAAHIAGAEPVLALMPTSGDVDVVIAAELVEAGRSIIRGIVTPDRTTLITSTHRIYAISEKSAMGSGLVDSDTVLARAKVRAKQCIALDMESLAESNGCVISAVLYGALAGSGVLNMPREDFEDTIRAYGKAVPANLAGFDAGYQATQDRLVKGAGPGGKGVRHAQSSPRSKEGKRLLARMQQEVPTAVLSTAYEGVRRTVDFQDPQYGDLYLDLLAKVVALDNEAARFELSCEVARFLALWMTYEDTIRVADLKIRTSRFERVRNELHVSSEQIVHVTEFMHPRIEEICDTLPAPLGRKILDSPRLRAFLGLFTRRGRRVSTNKLGGFLMLYGLAGLRCIRRSSLRYRVEHQRISAWLGQIIDTVPLDYALAVEIARCQRLIKGYGDTHMRGTRNFETILSNLDLIKTLDDPAKYLVRLREAALADEEGASLAKELSSIRG